jgi:hypothetical protein
MNYPIINKDLIIIKGIKLLYIFILYKLSEFKFQSWFDKFLDSFVFQPNLEMFELT